jgi:hypothetical protein
VNGRSSDHKKCKGLRAIILVHENKNAIFMNQLCSRDIYAVKTREKPIGQALGE